MLCCFMEKENLMNKKLINLMRPEDEYDLLSKQRVIDGKENEYIDYLLEQEETVLNDFQNFLSKNKLSIQMLCLTQKI